ncbi:twin-arginine translocase TatA/TatE family subunit [Thermodesulfobacteriota bacterium]
MGMPGIVEWVVILFIILLCFGHKKIPDLMKGLGEGIKKFKKGISDSEEDVDLISHNTEVKIKNIFKNQME